MIKYLSESFYSYRDNLIFLSNSTKLLGIFNIFFNWIGNTRKTGWILNTWILKNDRICVLENDVAMHFLFITSSIFFSIAFIWLSISMFVHQYQEFACRYVLNRILISTACNKTRCILHEYIKRRYESLWGVENMKLIWILQVHYNQYDVRQTTCTTL